jgi:hypothetical protein
LSMDKGLLVDKVYQGMREQYDRKCDKIAAKALPQIKHVYETILRMIYPQKWDIMPQKANCVNWS